MIQRKSNQLAIVLALVLIGLNLRPTISAVGPVLPFIKADIPLSFTVTSLLTSLPILAIGIAMFTFRPILKKFNAYSVVAVCLLIIGGSNLCRLFANSGFDLLSTAITAGCGIAIIQAILPIVIKKNFPFSVALYMGFYVTAVMGGDALASALSPNIQRLTQSWQIALSSWSILAIFALAAWFWIRGQVNIDTIQLEESPIKFYQIPRAWSLAIFFGLGSASYSCVLAWLPAYFMEYGFDSVQAGLLLSLLTVMQVISGLIFPAMINKSLDRRPVLYLIATLLIIGYLGLILKPTYLYALWVSLLGLGIGGLFTMTLIVSMDHYTDPLQSGELAAFVQGVGYIIAACSPFIAGMIKDYTNSFTIAWSLLLLLVIIAFLMIRIFNPKEYPQKMTNHNQL
ncbi:MFS transporter [Neisseriaceae bacterium PsAf]|nr:MFS transporter [Neisseriaceae bacterium PsAf]